MNRDSTLEPLSYDPQLRDFIDAAWPRRPRDDARVRYWQAARRTTILVLLAFASLQYYFFDVQLTILALPRLTVAASAP